MVPEIERKIRMYALANAAKYDGHCNPSSVLAAVLKEEPSWKNNLQELRSRLDHMCSEVNTLGLMTILETLQHEFPEMLQQKPKEKKDDLRPLEDALSARGVVMRFAPSPSGPMHIGHAITGGLTALYVQKYGGRFILRIEDTNSDNIDPEAYHLLPEDAAWVFGNVTEVWIQSDRMQTYYAYAEKMLSQGAVYICTCTQEAFKKSAENMKDCPCRSLSKEEQRKRWADMTSTYKEGEAVVRFKSSMQDKNPAMRDFPLFRINDSVHPRMGSRYRVWPLMNFSVMVDDIEAGMTHIIRAKDHADNAKRQELMYHVLGVTPPKTYFLGRYNFEDMELSTSKTKARIMKGEFSGWDDIRLPFLRALKRRGYQPEVFLRYTRMTGLSLVDKKVSAEDFFKTINAFNKELIEPTSRRFFFLHDPVQITIEGGPEQRISIRMHPDHPEMGMRTFAVATDFLLEKSDVEFFEEGKLYRLMDCLNFRKKGAGYVFDSTAYDTFRKEGGRIMHFLPAGTGVKAIVRLDDGTILEGVAEENIRSVKVDDIVQFERFGFCRCDAIEQRDKNAVYTFWWTHK